jgi:predicted alpha/beta superfamily hydrolase
MYKLLLLLFIGFTTHSQAQLSNNQISTGFVDSLYSETLKESRKIWVHLPDARNDETDKTKKYPVIYAFDGGYLFNSLVSITELLSGSSLYPAVIIIGIIPVDRGRELTPTHVNNMAPYDVSDTTFSKTSGGGEALTTFLEKELIPYVESTYRGSSDRMLVGHSTGGLMVVNTLLRHPAMFTHYVAIDPAMWWDHQRLLLKSKVILQHNSLKGKALYLSLSNTLPPNMSLSAAEKDTSIKTLHFRSALRLCRIIQENPQTRLSFNWKYYPKDNHGSVALISAYDALRFFPSHK